jgi:hypothetical protein
MWTGPKEEEEEEGVINNRIAGSIAYRRSQYLF